MNLSEKTSKIIKNDRFYNKLYQKYGDFNLLVDAGFIDSKVDAKSFYNLNLLTTPVGKLLDNIKDCNNPLVLLSTGGFLPIHQGHLNMMELAKSKMEEIGYDVIGGYFSPSHEHYVSTKPYYNTNLGDRIFECQKAIENSSWLMIDPWESMYVKSYINFTSVIDRLEKYLQLHVDKRIKVGYVFGSDNAKFNYCFEDDGIGICINRSKNAKDFEEAKSKIKSKNCIFIDNNDISSQLSSRNIRINNSQNKSEKINQGTFLIRDEGLLPFQNLLTFVDKERLKKARKKFLDNLIILFKNELKGDIKISTINVPDQIKQAKEILKDKNTISLDSYFKGRYNLEITRLFDISSPQLHYLKMQERSDYPAIGDQLNKIPAGKFTLVDDDSVSGNTIKSIKELLPKQVEITDIFLLSKLLNDDYFDVVDLRDFIIGCNNSGLTIRLPDFQTARSPYILPYTNLVTRSSVSPKNQFDFSIALWQLNFDFYNHLGQEILLKQTDNSFQKLMRYVGFNNNSTLKEICLWHIEKLNSTKC